MTSISFEQAVQFAHNYLKEHKFETAKDDMLRQLRFRFAYRAGIAFFDADGKRAPEPSKEEQEALEKETIETLAERVFSNVECSDEKRRYRLVFTGEETDVVDWLIEHSGSPIVFASLRDITSSMASCGLPYQGKLREWVADYISGRVVRPSRGGHIKAKTLYRDLLVNCVIYELVERGLTPTRNDVSPAISACDAVAEACLRIGTDPRSFQSVKRIWLQQERVLRYFP